MTVQATVAQANSATVEIQMPTPGFRLLSFRPMLYRASNGLLLSSTAAQEELVFTLKEKDSENFYTRQSAPFWSLEGNEVAEDWTGFFWPEKVILEWTFQRTSSLSLHAENYLIRVAMRGFLEPPPQAR